MEADIQGADFHASIPPLCSQGAVVGVTTLGIPGQEWERACRRRRSFPHLYRENAEKLLLRRRQGQRSGRQRFVTLILTKRFLTILYF